MNTPFSFLIALTFLLNLAFATGQSLNEPKQVFASAGYLKEWGNEVALELRNWVGDSCRHLLIWTKEDLAQYIVTAQQEHADSFRLMAIISEKSALMQGFLATQFPKYPLQQMVWPSESLAAQSLDNTLDNVACAYVFKHKDQSDIWDAFIIFMSYPQVQEFELGKIFGAFTTGVPSTQLRNFQVSNREWHRCFMRHEAAHIRMRHGDAYKKSRHQPLICETEADVFALSDSLFAPDKHPIKEKLHAIRAMASLFNSRDENQKYQASVNRHATNVFLDPLGHLEKDPVKAASAFCEVHWKINLKAHLLLSEADSSLGENKTAGEYIRRVRGEKIALDNPPMFFTAIKILAEQGQFPADSPEAILCAEFLEACEQHIAPEYLYNPETLCFYEQCVALMAAVKKEP